MDGTSVMDALFFLGASACAGFLAYGGWLCRIAHGLDSTDTSPEAKAADSSPRKARMSDLSSSVSLPPTMALAFLVTLGIDGISRLLA